jgi:hypothetical protein
MSHPRDIYRVYDVDPAQAVRSTRDEQATVPAYAQRARSALYRVTQDTKPMSTLDAFAAAAARRPEAAHVWRSRLHDVPDDALGTIVTRVPDPVMSKTSQRFVMRFLAWQNPEKRGIRVVGRLSMIPTGEETIYEFVYLEGARRAQRKYGFQPFLAFPELDNLYRSNRLFPFFTNRVVPSKRGDYPAYIEELGLTRDDATPERILSRGGGRRMTDHVEIFAPPQRDPESGLDEMFFLLRGLRYMSGGTEERIANLERGTQLSCMLDFQNPHNLRAVMLRTGDNVLLGYVPDYLADDVALLRKNEAPLLVHVERVNPPPAPQGHRLLCRLQARWPVDHAPFSDERFQPLVTPTDSHTPAPALLAGAGGA